MFKKFFLMLLMSFSSNVFAKSVVPDYCYVDFLYYKNDAQHSLGTKGETIKYEISNLGVQFEKIRGFGRYQYRSLTKISSTLNLLLIVDADGIDHSEHSGIKFHATVFKVVNGKNHVITNARSEAIMPLGGPLTNLAARLEFEDPLLIEKKLEGKSITPEDIASLPKEEVFGGGIIQCWSKVNE